MPRSSASRSLARLEAAAGAALIERSTRHLRLTDAGRLLQRHARRILDDVGEAENALTGLIGAPRGTRRVSVGFTFAVGSPSPWDCWRRCCRGSSPATPRCAWRSASNTATSTCSPRSSTARLRADRARCTRSRSCLLPEYGDDAVDVHAFYPSHGILSAKVRVFIEALAEHLRAG